MTKKVESMGISQLSKEVGISYRNLYQRCKKMFPNDFKNGKKFTLDDKKIALIKIVLNKNKGGALKQISKKMTFDTKASKVVGVALTKEEKQLELTLRTQQLLKELEAQNNTLQKEIVQLKDVIKENQPKIDFYNAVANTEGLTTMSVFAKTINWGRNRLMEQLRKDNILMKNNNPAQTYIDRRLFTLKKVKTNVGVVSSPLITNKGQIFLTKHLKKA